MDYLRLGLRLGIPVALLASLWIVTRLDRGSAIARRIRSRLLLGMPWGTLLSALLVSAFYLFVQRGFWYPGTPLTIPFTSWSYLYPLGVATAPFAHQSLGHLTGNMIGLVTVGTLAEYAFSHFPQARGSAAFDDWKTHPYVRAFVLVPVGVFLIGLLTSVFAWGPIIGFSGVVFAVAGFALVRFPLATVVALVAREFVRTVYLALRDPIVYASAGPSFGPPWWAGIAIQGHLLGFLLGAALAAAILTRRRESGRPGALRLWVATVIVGSSLTLWAIWWYSNGSSYVLYRGVGVLLVAVLGVLLAVTVGASNARFVAGLTRRQVAMALLTLPILTMGFVAVPLNASTVGDATVPDTAVRVDGYSVTYAENVADRRIPAIDVSFYDESTTVNASGVIVINRDRQVWTEAVSTGRLAHSGQRTIAVGGLTWRRTVEAKREGWRVSGGEIAYRISLRPGDGGWRPVFLSPPVRAEPTIAGRNVTVRPENRSFVLEVTRDNRSLGRAPIPAVNESIVIGGLDFTRRGGRIAVSHNDTRLPLLQKEEYE